MRSTSALKRRKEGDAELWLLLSKVLVTQLNTRQIKTMDLLDATRNFVNAKVRSDKLYSYVIRYLMSQKPAE